MSESFEVKLMHNNTLKNAEILYFDKEHDKDFLAKWEKSLDKNFTLHPAERDAVEFAESAYMRWKAYKNRDNYAYSIQDIKDFIKDNPNAEVANFVLLKWDLEVPSSVLGLCHFRRTWCNNLIIDYLVVHPTIAKPDRITIKGVGTSLLYYIAKVSTEIDVKYIWGEATQNSYTFYNKLFEINSIRDLILVKKRKYITFFNTISEKYQERKER